ncbi:MAG: hypothetical protein GYB36_00900 [Alphaproteobacteria bacterium]|nr:hypothetical protein [Alphaproteobacteria bacterium]
MVEVKVKKFLGISLERKRYGFLSNSVTSDSLLAGEVEQLLAKRQQVSIFHTFKSDADGDFFHPDVSRSFASELRFADGERNSIWNSELKKSLRERIVNGEKDVGAFVRSIFPSLSDDWAERLKVIVEMYSLNHDLLTALKYGVVACEVGSDIYQALCRFTERLKAEELDCFYTFHLGHLDYLLEVACADAELEFCIQPIEVDDEEQYKRRAVEKNSGMLEELRYLRSVDPGVVDYVGGDPVIPFGLKLFASYYIAGVMPGNMWPPMRSSIFQDEADIATDVGGEDLSPQIDGDELDARLVEDDYVARCSPSLKSLPRVRPLSRDGRTRWNRVLRPSDERSYAIVASSRSGVSWLAGVSEKLLADGNQVLSLQLAESDPAFAAIPNSLGCLQIQSAIVKTTEPIWSEQLRSRAAQLLRRKDVDFWEVPEKLLRSVPREWRRRLADIAVMNLHVHTPINAIKTTVVSYELARRVERSCKKLAREFVRSRVAVVVSRDRGATNWLIAAAAARAGVELFEQSQAVAKRDMMRLQTGEDGAAYQSALHSLQRTASEIFDATNEQPVIPTSLGVFSAYYLAGMFSDSPWPSSASGAVLDEVEEKANTLQVAKVASQVAPWRLVLDNSLRSLGEYVAKPRGARLRRVTQHLVKRPRKYAIVISTPMCRDWFAQICRDLKADRNEIILLNASDFDINRSNSLPGVSKIVDIRFLREYQIKGAEQERARREIQSKIGRRASDYENIIEDMIANQPLSWHHRSYNALVAYLGQYTPTVGLRGLAKALDYANALRLHKKRMVEVLSQHKVDVVVSRYRGHLNWIIEQASRVAGVEQLQFPDAVTKPAALKLRAYDKNSELGGMIQAFKEVQPDRVETIDGKDVLPLGVRAYLGFYVADMLPRNPWASLHAGAKVKAKDEWIYDYAVSRRIPHKSIERVAHPLFKFDNPLEEGYVLVNVAANVFSGLEPNDIVGSYDGYVGVLEDIVRSLGKQQRIVLSLHPRIRSDEVLTHRLRGLGEVSDLPAPALLRKASLFVTYMCSSVNFDALRADVRTIAFPIFDAKVVTPPEEHYVTSSSRFSVAESRDELMHLTSLFAASRRTKSDVELHVVN